MGKTFNFLSGSLPSGVTLTRASSGRYYDVNGTQVSVSSDVARFDYDPVTHAAKGLLIEESRQNICTYSEDFRDTATAGGTRPWSYLRMSISADATTAPDGTLTADKMVEDTSASTTHYVYRTDTVSAGTYAISIYIKKAQDTPLRRCTITTTGVGTASVSFNANDGTSQTITSTSLVATGMDSVGNGWYRVYVVVNTTAGSLQTQFRLMSNASQNFTGDGASGIYLWGAQIESGSFPTSYVPVTSSAATRAADLAYASLGSWYGAASGSILVEFTQAQKAAMTAISLDDGTASNYLQIGAADATNYSVLGAGFSGTQPNATCGAQVIGTNSMLITYGPSILKVALNGVETLSLSNTGNVPLFNTVRFGSNKTNLTPWLNGHVRSALFSGGKLSYPQKLRSLADRRFQ